MKLLASVAGGSLRDEVGQRAVQRVEEFADEIMSIVYIGEERILELEKKIQKENDDMEKVKGMSR